MFLRSGCVLKTESEGMSLKKGNNTSPNFFILLLFLTWANRWMELPWTELGKPAGRGRFGGRFGIQFSHIRLRSLLNILVELANRQLDVWVYSFGENPGVGIIRVLVVFIPMRKDKSIKEISERKGAEVWSLGHTRRLQRSGRRGMKETKGGITEVNEKQRTWCSRKWKWLSCVRLFVTPWTVEFSRPEYWSG